MDLWHNHRLGKQFVIITLTCIWLGGCLSYDRVLQTWVGKSEIELLEDWGKPDTTYTFDNGETIHTWIDLGTNSSGPYTCQKSITVNSKHTVVKGSSRGCPSVTASTL